MAVGTDSECYYRPHTLSPYHLHEPLVACERGVRNHTNDSDPSPHDGSAHLSLRMHRFLSDAAQSSTGLPSLLLMRSAVLQPIHQRLDA